MHSLARHFIYTAAAMYILQIYARPFDYGPERTKTFLIITLAISLIVYFSKPLLKLVSFPVGGFIYTVLLTLVIAAGFYALESVIPGFAVSSFFLPPAELFGIMLDGVQIEGLKSLGFVSAFVAVFIGVISWVMG